MNEIQKEKTRNPDQTIPEQTTTDTADTADTVLQSLVDEIELGKSPAMLQTAYEPFPRKKRQYKEYNMRVSTCEHYNHYQSKEDNHKKVYKDWKLTNVPWTFEEVTKLVTTQGISPSEFRHGQRKADFWLGHHCIMLDFDNGIMNTQKLLQVQTALPCDSFVFTSQNHLKQTFDSYGNAKPIVEKLRMLIPLAQPIRKKEELDIIKSIFMSQYPKAIDSSFMDRTRYFAHGNLIVSSFKNTTGPLKWKELPGYGGSNQNVQDAEKELEKKSTAKRNEEMAKWTFSLADSTKDAERRQKLISEIPLGSPIYCPSCGEAEYRSNSGHNATLFVNDDGYPTIYCSSCAAREEGVAGKGIYNLTNDDKYFWRVNATNTFAFEDINTGSYYGLSKKKETGQMTLAKLPSWRSTLNFMSLHNLQVPSRFPRMYVQLRFDKDVIIDYDSELVNKYIPPALLLTDVKPDHKYSIPPTIKKVMMHVMDNNEKVFESFIHNFANLLQTRKKMLISYIFQGTEGTGKGIMFNNILSPIIGEDYCMQDDQDNFSGRFNSVWTDYLLMLIDEVKAERNQNGRAVSSVDKIKRAITDVAVAIERKGVDKQKGVNNCTFMFGTNSYLGLILPKDDRRFIVAPRQEQKIIYTDWWPEEFEMLAEQIKAELPEFVCYLKSLEIKKKLINIVIDNEAKRAMQAMSTTNTEDFFNAIKEGDLEFFQDFAQPSGNPYDEQLDAEMRTFMEELPKRKGLATPEMCKLYNYINKKRMNTLSFMKVAAQYLPKAKPIRENGNVYKGRHITWVNHSTIFNTEADFINDREESETQEVKDLFNT